MATDDHETELHLTPNGWVRGSERVNGRPTKTIDPPVDRVETWIEEISDSSEGWDPPTISSKLIWKSPTVSSEVRAELNQRFPRPEYKPWKKLPKKKRRVSY
jgi:hypothetical protein